MANEESSRVERMASFIIRLVVSLLLPVWGLIMIVLGVTWGIGWWIATGLWCSQSAWFSLPEARS